MFSVDEPTAEAIRRAYDEGGELSGIIEFRRHFPLITDNAKAGECVRIIIEWKPRPATHARARPVRLSYADAHDPILLRRERCTRPERFGARRARGRPGRGPQGAARHG